MFLVAAAAPGRLGKMSTIRGFVNLVHDGTFKSEEAPKEERRGRAK